MFNIKCFYFYPEVSEEPVKQDFQQRRNRIETWALDTK